MKALKSESENLKLDKRATEQENDDLLGEVEYLELNNKSLKSATKRLNCEMVGTRARLLKKNLEDTKDPKGKIKY